MSGEEKIIALEKEVTALKNKGKDKWDIFQIIASLLIPASIAFAGYYYSQSMKQAEIASSENLANRQEIIAKANSRVGQAGVVSSFLDALLSKEPQRRKLAIQAVLIALPDDGPKLVKIVEETDPDQSVVTFAKESLNDRRFVLVRQLFDDKAEQRISAASELIGGWREDPKVVEMLITYARENKQNNNGIYNTMVVLTNLDLKALKPYETELQKFSHEVESNGEMTKNLSEKLRNKLTSSA
jgi:hypothetical protein